MKRAGGSPLDKRWKGISKGFEKRQQPKQSRTGFAQRLLNETAREQGKCTLATNMEAVASISDSYKPTTILRTTTQLDMLTFNLKRITIDTPLLSGSHPHKTRYGQSLTFLSSISASFSHPFTNASCTYTFSYRDDGSDIGNERTAT